jgi:adenylate cyclase, class 2
MLETNIFLDTEDRALLAHDQGLRLRENKDPATGRTTYVITFKGPRHQGPLKSRDETELEVADARNAIELLGCLGYKTVISFEKRRQTWKFAGCKVEIDDLPYLGTFVEVEGPDNDTVLKAREKLNLNGRPIVKSSYVALMMSHLQEAGEHSRIIKFT